MLLQKSMIRRHKIEKEKKRNYFQTFIPKVSKKVKEIGLEVDQEVKNANKMLIKHVKKTSKKFEQLQEESSTAINKTLKEGDKRLQKALLKASKILLKAKKSKISPFFVSPDIALQRYSISKQINKNLEENLKKKIELKKGIETGLVQQTTIKKYSALEKVKRALILLIRRILAWLNFETRRNQLTKTGQKALAQLQDLYNLLLLEAYDEQSLAALRVAYGEACFYISEASRQYYKKHQGKGREYYQEYFDRFVRAVQSI
ncbi:MAG: hypothetical protein ACK4J0_03670 [Candidatus Anstonellaceae archaeon]